jgi:hypothetical protein
MAEKLSVQIALEGGDEIARQLGDIGKAGTKAFTDIGRAAEKVGGFNQLDPTEVTTRLAKMGVTGVDAINKIQTAVQQAGRLEQVVAGVKKLEDGFDQLGISVDKFANKMAGSLGPLGVFARALGPLGIALAVAGAAFLKFGDDSAKALGTLNTEGAKLDLTAQEFDKFQKALTKLGVPAEAVTSDMEKLKAVFGTRLFRLGDLVPPEATTGFQQFIGVLERMPDGVARTQLAIQTLGDVLGGAVIAGLQTGTLGAEKYAATLAGITPATQAQIVQAAQYQQSINQLSDAWTRFKAEVAAPVGAPVLDFLTAQLPGIQAGIATTVREFQALWSVINTVASGGAAVIGALAAPIELVISAVGRLASALAGWNWNPITAGVQAWNDLTAAIQSAIDAVLRFIGLKPSGGTPAPAAAGGGQFAGGGLLGGRGTGTSDSNLAWVSRGEHIMPARAVAQPGVLAFLEALRRSGGNLSRVLDGMGRFALGGLVPRMPAFAAGGAVGSMSHVTIAFPGLPEIGGLRASSAVVDELRKSAALAQVRSGGRKPSRYS